MNNERELFEAWATSRRVGVNRAHYAWQGWEACAALKQAECARYREALESFLYEYGDKANSATVQKARDALKGQP